MSRIFKSFNPGDIRITPFITHKEWNVTNRTTASIGVIVYEGRYGSGSLPIGTPDGDDEPQNSAAASANGYTVSSSFKQVIWESINHLYYEFKDTPFNRFGGQNIATESRQIHDRISVISVPQQIIGEGIERESIILIDSSSGKGITIKDDGNGNLYDESLPSGSSISKLVNDNKYLVGHWGFDEGYRYINKTTSDISIKDSSINKSDGVVENVVFKRGAYGTQCVFNDTGSVRITHNEQINFFDNEDFAVSVEITVPASQSTLTDTENDVVIKNGKGSRTVYVGNDTTTVDDTILAGYPYAIRVYNETHPTAPGKLEVSRFDGITKTIVTSSAKINDGRIHHIVFNRSGSNLQLWVDAVQQGSNVVDRSNGDTRNLSDLWVGKRGDGNRAFSGSVDELRIYNRGLNSTEILNISSSKINSRNIGNVFYQHGIMVITDPRPEYRDVVLGSSPRGFNLTFRGTRTIYENEYACNVKESELNMTMNPTIRLNSDINEGRILAFTTHSAFNPYITAVGLYNDQGQLLAVGKLAQAIKKPIGSDITIVARFDT